MINRKKMISLLLTMAFTCGMFMPAYATEIDDTKKKAEELGVEVEVFQNNSLPRVRRHLLPIN